MSLWGLVSTLSDSGAAFLASTARDLAEFKHALQDETSDMQAAIRTSSATGATHTQSVRSHAATREDERHELDAAAKRAEASGAAVERSGGGSSVTSSLSSLSSNFERLGGRVLHLLPTVFKQQQHEGHSVDESSSATGPPPSPPALVDGSERVASSRVTPPRQGSGGTSGGEFHQRWLAVMRDRRTYKSDPVEARTGQPTEAYVSFASAFLTRCSEQSGECDEEWAAALSSHPSVRHWHEALVEAGRVEARQFWCRYEFARQGLLEEERRRQKLADRLAGITTHSTRQQQKEAEADTDDTWDDDEEEQQRPLQAAASLGQGNVAERSGEEPSRAEELCTPLSPHRAQQQLSAAGDAQTPQRVAETLGEEASVASVRGEAVQRDAEAGSEGDDGELLSPSPVGSEGSGELVDLPDTDAPSEAHAAVRADGREAEEEEEAEDEGEAEAERAAGTATGEHNTKLSQSTPARAAARAQNDGHDSDYDDWE